MICFFFIEFIFFNQEVFIIAFLFGYIEFLYIYYVILKIKLLFILEFKKIFTHILKYFLPLIRKVQIYQWFYKLESYCQFL